jgi:hypothetical protein
MDSRELNRMAAEASVLHGIRIDADDPLMAVVTINRMVFESALEEALQSIRTTTEELNQAIDRVQIRAGSAVALEVRECVSAIRGELQRDIDEARLNARALIEALHRAQTRRTMIQWVAAGAIAGAFLFAAGFCVAVLMR